MKPQKVGVLAQKDGQIIAVQTASLEPECLRYKAGADFAAQPDQVVYEFEVPQELAHHDDIPTLHRELLGYQVEVRKGASRLIRKRAS